MQTYQEGATHRVVIKTTDGGRSWRELPLVQDAHAQAFGVGFVNETWGWVGTLNSGYETRDGGSSWTAIEMGRAVNKIRIVRDSKGFSVFAIGVSVSRLDG